MKLVVTGMAGWESLTSDILKQGYISEDQRHCLRNQCDTHADAILSMIQCRRKEGSEPSATRQRHDLYIDLQEGSKDNDTMAKFWTQVNTTPDWVDWSQLERGQRVFHRYILASITGFVLQGFIAENSTAAGVVEVLIRTGGFDPKNLTRRLEETFRWLLEVTSDLQSVQPGGKGHADTIRVRLLHAQVRQRILTLAERKAGYYDTVMHGIPVNTLDSIHSISTFCCSPMWTQLPRMGIRPTDSEIEDYLALFRYLAHLLGVPQELFSSTDLARGIMHSMMENECRVTDTSRVIARNFIATITSSTPHKLSLGFIAAGSRCMNGHSLCDALDIPRPGLVDYATYLGCCWLAVALCHVQRAFGVCDRFFVLVCDLADLD